MILDEIYAHYVLLLYLSGVMPNFSRKSFPKYAFEEKPQCRLISVTDISVSFKYFLAMSMRYSIRYSMGVLLMVFRKHRIHSLVLIDADAAISASVSLSSKCWWIKVSIFCKRSWFWKFTVCAGCSLISSRSNSHISEKDFLSEIPCSLCAAAHWPGLISAKSPADFWFSLKNQCIDIFVMDNRIYVFCFKMLLKCPPRKMGWNICV